MKITDIKPFIRNVSKFTVNNSALEGVGLSSYDYCMLYMIDGSWDITVNDNLFCVKEGDILIWMPGAVYSFSNHNENTTYILIHFDYVNDDNIAKSYPMRPVPAEQFEKSKMMKKIKFTDVTAFNDTVHLTKMYILEEFFYNILTEHKRRERFFDYKISAIMSSVLADVARNLEQLGRINVKNDKTSEILAYIHTNFNKSINNKKIGERFNFHPQYVSELVKARTGYTLYQYILMRKISKAIYYLQGSNMPIIEIVDLVGFKDAAHFSKSFKQIMGVSPKQYREKSQQKL